MAVTSLGALLGRLEPGLVSSTRPHPTLHPTLSATAAILANNVRVLAAPLILIAARFARSSGTRIAGDTIIAAILAGNAAMIGLAIGRWEGTLFPYLPQLPLEYLATSTAAGAWLHTRRRAFDGTDAELRVIAAYAATTMLLLAGAATVEVLVTPHAR